MKECEIQMRILVALSKEFPRISIFWTNDTGVGKSMGGKRTSRFGCLGSPDILSCLGGRFIGIEVKTPTGKQREAQHRLRVALERAGRIYIVARSPESARAQINASLLPL